MGAHAFELVAVNAEWLVEAMDHDSMSISKEWIGLILLPTVSAIAGACFGFGENFAVVGLIFLLVRPHAECITAVNVSVKDQLTLSISVAVGSTIVRPLAGHFSNPTAR